MPASRAVLLLAALALALSACSGEISIGGIDQEEVESEVVRVLEEGFDLGGVNTADFGPWEADCSDTPSTLEEGDTFTCTGTDVEGDNLDVTITATDDEGNIRITPVE
jgi:hypothetical protein